MNCEDKYNSALERAKKLYGKYCIDNVLESLFPELKESEEDKIRKQIISFLKEFKYNHYRALDFSSWIAWLEKQGEKPQGKSALEAIKEEKVDNANRVGPKFKVKYACGEYNVLEVKEITGVTYYGIEDEPNHIDYVLPDDCEIISGYDIKENGSPYPTKPAVFSEQKSTDNVKPKFKVGDWVVYDHRTYQVVELPKEGYINLGLIRNGKIEFAPSTYCRFWTIEDAKDGDVLYSSFCKLIWLYKDKKTCYLGNNLNYHSDSIVVNNPICIPDDARPATKDEQTTFFAKIKELGYEWDANKKELQERR